MNERRHMPKTTEIKAKPVRLTKALGRETQKFLGYMDVLMEHSPSMKDFRAEIRRNGWLPLLAKWNSWWRGELAKTREATEARKRRKAEEAKFGRASDIKPHACPKCGSTLWVEVVHPTYDGGAYIHCEACHYAPQAETWAPTDVGAIMKWNALCEQAKKKEKEAGNDANQP